MNYNHHAIARVERAAHGHGGRDDRLPIDLSIVVQDMLRAIERLERDLLSVERRLDVLENRR